MPLLKACLRAGCPANDFSMHSQPGSDDVQPARSCRPDSHGLHVPAPGALLGWLTAARLQFEGAFGDTALLAAVERRRAEAHPQLPARDVLHVYLTKYRRVPDRGPSGSGSMRGQPSRSPALGPQQLQGCWEAGSGPCVPGPSSPGKRMLRCVYTESICMHPIHRLHGDAQGGCCSACGPCKRALAQAAAMM